LVREEHSTKEKGGEEGHHYRSRGLNLHLVNNRGQPWEERKKVSPDMKNPDTARRKKKGSAPKERIIALRKGERVAVQKKNGAETQGD